MFIGNAFSLIKISKVMENNKEKKSLTTTLHLA